MRNLNVFGPYEVRPIFGNYHMDPNSGTAPSAQDQVNDVMNKLTGMSKPAQGHVAASDCLIITDPRDAGSATFRSGIFWLNP